jgi:hypothetical protein
MGESGSRRASDAMQIFPDRGTGDSRRTLKGSRQAMPQNRIVLPHELPKRLRQNAQQTDQPENKKGLDAIASSPENVPEAANPRGAEDSSYFRGRLVVCVTRRK